MNPAPHPAPDHIPPERILDVDIYDLPGANDDVHAAWQQLARTHDLVWTPRNGGHWIATSGDVVERLFRDTGAFSNREIAVPPGTMAIPQLPIMADGDAHRAYRAIIEPAFKPAHLEVYRRQAQTLTDELIDGFHPRGYCEFSSEYALILPLVIFLLMMDLPLDDRESLHAHVRVMTHEADAAKRQAAFRGIIDYLEVRIAERRRNPGDDLLSRVLDARISGRPLDHQEILGMSSLLLFGGLDTVASMMGFVMRFLAENPEHRRWIIDNPARRSFAIEEIMRRHGVANLMRTAVHDVEIGGVTVQAGDYITVTTCLHGLDPRKYPSPEKVDFERAMGHPPATFGYGPHRCPGNGLARMEMGVMVEKWLARIPEFEVDPEGEVVQASGGVNGVLRLPLRWPVA